MTHEGHVPVSRRDALREQREREDARRHSEADTARWEETLGRLERPATQTENTNDAA